MDNYDLTESGLLTANSETSESKSSEKRAFADLIYIDKDFDNPPFKVNDKYKNTQRPLTEKEYNNLKDGIVKNGCLEPLIIDERTEYLVDGYHREKICRENKIPYSVKRLDFKDEQEILFYVLTHQEGRRNNNGMETDLNMARIYNNCKMAPNGYRDKEECTGDNREWVAKLFNRSKSSVTKSVKLLESYEIIVDVCGKEIADKITRGEILLNRTEINAIARYKKADIEACMNELKEIYISHKRNGITEIIFKYEEKYSSQRKAEKPKNETPTDVTSDSAVRTHKAEIVGEKDNLKTACSDKFSERVDSEKKTNECFHHDKSSKEGGKSNKASDKQKCHSEDEVISDLINESSNLEIRLDSFFQKLNASGFAESFREIQQSNPTDWMTVIRNFRKTLKIDSNKSIEQTGDVSKF
ncbi:MAG: hypothetical protein JXA60_05565 [Candidatus Coatesbacteria bacterium]|nr:hypothetical protein [Candidatus Coatesbacteria bacterium]